MQIIYAAPFVLISILGFGTCLALRPLRKFALPVLVAPIAFGVCSIAGWILFALLAHFVLRAIFGPLVGFLEVTAGILFYLVPGIAGAWITVWFTLLLEQRILKTSSARDITIRVVVAMIAAFLGGIAGLGFAEDLLPPGSTVASLWIGALVAILLAAAGFTITWMIQRRTVFASRREIQSNQQM